MHIGNKLAGYVVRLVPPIQRHEPSAALGIEPGQLSAEEFALGGNRIGRAFAFNELTGDRGFGGDLELSYRLADPKRAPGGIQLFGFIDGGAVFQAKSPIVADRRRALASVGVGTRFSIAGAAFSAEAGVPVVGSADSKPVPLFFSTYRAF